MRHPKPKRSGAYRAPFSRMWPPHSTRPIAEYVVADGPVCVWSQRLLRTSAGIAAAAARHWDRAEEHFRMAIHQSDSAPFRHAQPIARQRYAEMLLARDMPGDRERACELLEEALQMCHAVGLPWHAQRIENRIPGRVG